MKMLPETQPHAMLDDSVLAMRAADVFEEQFYRHINGTCPWVYCDALVFSKGSFDMFLKGKLLGDSRGSFK
jgi:hypothetical protein